MRKNAPRKWLHAILDLLPVILIPVFMIYSHRHTIDSGSIDVPQNQVVDFNQQFKYSSYSTIYSGITLNVNNNGITLNGTLDVTGDFFDFTAYYFDSSNSIYLKENHKYLIKNDIYTEDIILYFYQLTEDNPQYITYSSFDAPRIFTPTQSGSTLFKVRIGDNTTFDNYTFKPQLFDLTQMFGSGNEPSVQQFTQWYSDDYYPFTLSHKELLKGISTITYDDTDIMSQSMYQLYNAVDKYFNMNNVFNMGNVYDWFNLNIFNGNAPIIMYIVWNIALYELVMDLMFLLYALFMWFVDWCKSLIERTYDTSRGK